MADATRYITLVVECYHTFGGVRWGRKHTKRASGAIDERFRGRISRRGDTRYEEDRIVWNGMRDAHPDIIARCSGVGDVKEAVAFAPVETVTVME